MIFELSNDIVPILLCFTIYMSVFTIHIACSIIKEYRIHHRWKSKRDMQSAFALSLSEQDGKEEAHQQQNFLTRIVKRKEAPEDDADYQVFSNVMNKNNRGGQRWNLYSLSLKSKDS